MENPAAGDLGKILAEALRLLQDKKDPQKKAEKYAARKAEMQPKDNPSLLKKSFAKPNISKRPYISSRIKNEIYLRDHGQCTYQNKEGIRCRAKTGLHLDHIRPFALGGETALENLRLRCAGHNLRSAMDVFGDDFIRKKIEKNQRK